MKSNIRITFWLCKTKTNKKRHAPIYVRVADGQDYFTMTTGKYIKPSDWIKQSMKVKGNTEEASLVNEYLDAFRNKIQRFASQLMLGNEPFSIYTIKEMLQGNGKNQIKLVEYFSKCLKDMKSLEGTDYKQTTVIKYTNTRNRLKEFIQKTYKRGDVYLYELNFTFMDEFMRFLKGSYSNNQTTCYKHYQRFTKIVRYAVKKGLMDRYPFMDYKIKLPKPKVEFLTQEEIDRIDKAELHHQRLRHIRDIFVFCCYTGLAYTEINNLKPVHIILGQDGNRWLYIDRQKTGKSYQAPLLPRAEEILDKYLVTSNNNDKIFPVPSNVKYNAYLKEIAVIAKVSKALTTHLARKSFSVSVMLTNGVSIGVLSKCLGHSSVRITLDCYSSIVDKRILDEIGSLRQKLTGKHQA